MKMSAAMFLLVICAPRNWTFAMVAVSLSHASREMRASGPGPTAAGMATSMKIRERRDRDNSNHPGRHHALSVGRIGIVEIE